MPEYPTVSGDPAWVAQPKLPVPARWGSSKMP